MEIMELNSQDVCLTVGTRLKRARESMRLSVEQVAHYLRLDSKIIHELEADNFQNNPRFAFIRGYLRSYARLVDLNADEIIKQFNGLGLNEQVLESFSSAFDKTLAIESKSRLRDQWVPYGLLVALLLAGIFTYYVLSLPIK